MPRPDATPEFIAALQSEVVRPVIFVELGLTTGPLYMWTGAGSLTWAGRTWAGVGQFGTLSPIEEGADVQARGVTLTLTGLDLALLADVMTEYRSGLPAVVYFGVRDATGALVPNPVVSWAGRTDQPTISVDADSATI